MLKDNNDSSNYKYSWWQVVNVSSGVTLNSGVKATKGTICYVTLAQKTGTKQKLSVNAKGNNSKLDTVISGQIKDFNE